MLFKKIVLIPMLFEFKILFMTSEKFSNSFWEVSIGIWILKVEPIPTLLSTSILPFKTSSNFLVMLKPKPAPDCSFPIWTKLSKIFLIFSSDIPIPLS